MTLKAAKRRVSVILLFEPSWIAECMSAVSAFLWALFNLCGDDYLLTGKSLTLPLIGLMFGPVRTILLFRLTAFPRVLAAICGFVWWGIIGWALYQQRGVIGGVGLATGLLVGEFCTVLKFSIMASRSGNRDDV